jgi:hypothetical protein
MRGLDREVETQSFHADAVVARREGALPDAALGTVHYDRPVGFGDKVQRRLDDMTDKAQQRSDDLKVKNRERAEKANTVAAWRAWDEGASFYAPRFLGQVASLGAYLLPDTPNDPPLGSGRHEWADLLGDIESVGWELSEWAVAYDSKRNTTDAFPVFRRPSVPDDG